MDRIKFREQMVLDGVRSYFDGNNYYFYVDDIREKYDFARVHELSVEEKEIEGQTVKLVLPDKIDLLSEFDMMILRSRNPKK